MRIGELSRQSGVSQRSLRYYEERELITAERSPNGYREYAPAMVERASVIQQLFGMGFSREIVESVLSCTGNAPESAHAAAADTLTLVRDDLTAQIDRLSSTRARIDEFLDARAAVPA